MVIWIALESLASVVIIRNFGPGAFIMAQQVKLPLVMRSWLLSSVRINSVLAVAMIWGVTQLKEDLSLSVSFSPQMSVYNKNLKIFKKSVLNPRK